MREFEDRVAGILRGWQLRYDLAGWQAEKVIAHNGQWMAPNRPPTIEDLLGRPMLSIDPRDEDLDPDDGEADEAEMLEDVRETAEVLEGDGLVRRGRYTPEQMAAMNRGEPVS